MKTVLIMRGCPGSGKKSYLDGNYPHATVCSANDYFYNESGEYVFVPSEVPASHDFCRAAYEEAIANEVKIIAVCNCNVKLWEFQKYLITAQEHGYDVEVICMRVKDLDMVARRNIYDVPVEKVKDMYKKMERFPGEIYIDPE